MFGYDDFFTKKSKKQRQRDTLEENRRRGRVAEEQVRFEYEIRGYEMCKTHTGRDFEAVRRDMFIGRVIDHKYIEVKSGNAKLSDRQQVTKKKKKGQFVEERRDPLFW